MINWVIKATILLFTALILVPYLYKKLRPDEPPILEGEYDIQKNQASSKYGDFKSQDLPSADMPVFGPSMSTASRYTQVEIENEWLHPDISRYRKIWKEKASKQKEKKS